MHVRVGDMPVALMFDGPSLGGFVCPATITSAQLWKMGQVQAKDAVRFKPLTLGVARSLCQGIKSVGFRLFPRAAAPWQHACPTLRCAAGT